MNVKAKEKTKRVTHLQQQYHLITSHYGISGIRHCRWQEVSYAVQLLFGGWGRSVARWVACFAMPGLHAITADDGCCRRGPGS